MVFPDVMFFALRVWFPLFSQILCVKGGCVLKLGLMVSLAAL